jgi:hypothetical protein
MPKKPKSSTEESKDQVKGPKKALSPFFFYVRARRKTVKDTASALSTTEISKLIGQEWRSMSESDKAIYIELAAKDKERYDRQKKEFDETGTWTEESGSSPQHTAVKRKSDGKTGPNKRVSKK